MEVSYGSGIDPERIQKYAVYTYEGVMEDGTAFTRSFIVVKNDYQMIVRFTRLQDYAGVYRRGSFVPITSDPRPRLHYICRMLNFIIVEHGAAYQARHVFDITKPMMETFFADYALSPKKDITYRGEACINDCVSACVRFMGNLTVKFGAYMKIGWKDLYEEKHVRTAYGQRKVVYIPAFRIVGVPEVREVFRDLPTKAFKVLLSLAFRHTPDIAFAMCLQAFAGLRPGEACSVRQEKSPLGPGLFTTETGGQVTEVSIDLRKEMRLRSDGIESGRIKKERIQHVYPRFLKAFGSAYAIHKDWISKKACEAQYMPMFVNSRGMAMRYKNYLDRFHALVDNWFRPALLGSSDPELHLYGQLLCTNTLGPHALRHWFTVQLVLWGEDVAGIEYWRGDTNPQSALTYLRNKGDLNRELRAANDAFADLFAAAWKDIRKGGVDSERT